MELEDIEREKVIEFLKEYKRICEKFGIVIGACGCCNSPWLTVPYDEDNDIPWQIKHLLEEYNSDASRNYDHLDDPEKFPIRMRDLK